MVDCKGESARCSAPAIVVELSVPMPLVSRAPNSSRRASRPFSGLSPTAGAVAMRNCAKSSTPELVELSVLKSDTTHLVRVEADHPGDVGPTPPELRHAVWRVRDAHVRFVWASERVVPRRRPRP